MSKSNLALFGAALVTIIGCVQMHKRDQERIEYLQLELNIEKMRNSRIREQLRNFVEEE